MLFFLQNARIFVFNARFSIFFLLVLLSLWSFYALLNTEAWLESAESQCGKLCDSQTSLLGSRMTADESQLVGLTEVVNRIPHR